MVAVAHTSSDGCSSSSADYGTSRGPRAGGPSSARLGAQELGQVNGSGQDQERHAQTQTAARVHSRHRNSGPGRLDNSPGPEDAVCGVGGQVVDQFKGVCTEPFGPDAILNSYRAFTPRMAQGVSRMAARIVGISGVHGWNGNRALTSWCAEKMISQR
eukprot:373468-Hanusia_phi.AAC.2